MSDAIEIQEQRLPHRQSSNFTRSTMSKILSIQNASQANLNSSHINAIYEENKAERAKRFDNIQTNTGLNNHMYIKSEEFRLPLQKSSRIFNQQQTVFQKMHFEDFNQAMACYSGKSNYTTKSKNLVQQNSRDTRNTHLG